MVITLGELALEERIGRGGQAEVWSGIHRQQGVPVAVKVLTHRGGGGSYHQEALRNEIRTMAGLDHPAILMLFDCGEVSDEDERASDGELHRDSPYLVMELADGGSVAPLCGKPSWPEVRHILLAVLDALAHAHGRGVLHRDVKPSNVLRCGNGIRLSDFGVALRMEPDDSAVERAARIQGTPAYMAPEQFTGHWKNYGPATDLYALGCLAHSLVSGEPPFGRRTNFEAMYSLHAEAQLGPIDPGMAVPLGLDAWLKRLLEKRPSRRYQRAADAALALLALGDPPQSKVGKPVSSARSQANTVDAAERLSTLTCLPTVRAEAVTTSADRDSDPGLSTGPQIDLALDFPATWRRVEPVRRTMGMLGAGLSLHGLRAMPMVGRVPERDRLWNALTAVWRSRVPRLLVLEGNAGSGKTRLVEWLCERAHELGAATVLKATHSPLAGPGHGLAPMVARHLRTAGLSRGELDSHVRAVLAEQGVVDDDERVGLVELLAPTTGYAAASPPLVKFASATERYVLVARLIERISRRRPVILWLEDVQWGLDAIGLADHLLQRAARRIPVLLLLTARSESLAEQAEASSALSECTGRTGAARMRIEPLPQAEWPALLEQLLRLDEPLAQQVADRTQGNPLFAVHLVGDWLDRGLLEPGPEGFRLAEGRPIEQPTELQDIWRARIDHVLQSRSPEEAAALELAATLGLQVDGREWRDACAAADLHPSTELVEELLIRRLATTGQRGPREWWSFVHGMLRDSLEQRSAQAGRATAHHQACADMLRPRRGAGVFERLGRHLIAAGKPEQAFAPLRHGARERLNQGDFAQSNALLDQLEVALAGVDRPARDPRWGQCWILRARVAMKRGRTDDGRKWASRTEASARSHGWLNLLAEALLIQGMIYRTRGNTELAEQSLALARDMARDLGSDRLLAEVLEALGRLLMHRGGLDEAETCWHEARELFRAGDDAKGAASALWSLAHVASYKQHYELAEQFNESALGELERQGDRWGVGRCINTAGEISRLRGDLDAAERHYSRAGALMKALGADDSAAICATNVARVLVERGEYQEAREQLEQGACELEDHGRLDALAWIHTVLLACCAAALDWSAWAEHWESARFLLAESGYYDLDIAQAAQLAGQLAAEAEYPEPARQAYGLALEQWKALGRDADAAEVRRRLEMLTRLS